MLETPRAPPGDTAGATWSPASTGKEILGLGPPPGPGTLCHPLCPSPVPSSAYGVVRDPLEAKREVCEVNPDCDELADHIGFQEAYRRFYGTV